MALTERERITLLMMRGYGDRVISYREVRDLFNDTFPERNPISHSTVIKTVQRFELTGSVKDRSKSGRLKSATDDEHSLDVMQSVIENPHTSLRRVAQEHDIHYSSVRNVLKRNKCKPYKIHLLQELQEDDWDRRMEFCEIMMKKCDEDPNFLNSIVFSDEATFTLNGYVNRHNCRYWASENPHWMVESHTQHPEKVNVWAGIFGRKVIGPFFINGNLNSESYLHMLQNEVIPAIENVSGQHFPTVWFQQDGAPPHYGRQVRQYLDETFPQKWIGRRGAVEWPPRSPDLSPLDYFFWGHLKNNVYKTKPHGLDELRERIVQETRLISEQALHNAVSAVYTRFAHCQTVDGAHFEHLI